MNVIIACEESQAVCIEFRKPGIAKAMASQWG